jgi:hypothetical protein
MAKKQYNCVVSGKVIPKERVEALKMLGVPENRWTCVEHALAMPRKGIYMGENGTSELRIVDKVYNDSVRSVFGKAKKEKVFNEDPVVEEEEPDKGPYESRELNYYISDEDTPDPDEKIEIIKRHNP